MVKTVIEKERKGVVSIRIYLDEDEDVIVSFSILSIVVYEKNLTVLFQNIRRKKLAKELTN